MQNEPIKSPYVQPGNRKVQIDQIANLLELQKDTPFIVVFEEVTEKHNCDPDNCKGHAIEILARNFNKEKIAGLGQMLVDMADVIAKNNHKFND